MLKFLVVIDQAVESSFALRAACRLAGKGRGRVEALHVLDPSARTSDYGTGWAVRTYRREHLKRAYETMAGVIASEQEAYGPLPTLKVVHGKAAKEIIREVLTGSFDFLFMGRPNPLRGQHAGILLKLLRATPCPIILVNHYRPLQRVLLYVDSQAIVDRFLSRVCLLLAGLPVSVDLVRFCEPGGEKAAGALVDKVRKKMISGGLETGTRILEENPIQGINEIAVDYDLLVLGVPRPGRPGPLVTSLLQTMPTPLMLCP